MSPNDGPAIGAISVSGRATSDSGLVANPMLSEWISARTVTLDRFSRDCERRVMPVDLDWATTSGRAISASDGSNWGDAGRWHDNRLASGCNKTRFFHVESADFNSKYTKLHWELEIALNLITEQSTLINGDFATKIRRFCDFRFPKRKWKYQTRNRNWIQIVLPRAVSMRVWHGNTRESVYITRNATVHVLLAAIAR